MTATLKISDLEICQTCIDGTSHQYDFNLRCCRARHSLSMSKPMRQTKYARLAEKYGAEYAQQHVRDVGLLYQFMQSTAEDKCKPTA